MATRRANRRGVAGAPATATAASMMASPAAAAASSRADLSAAAARTPLPAVTLDELVVGGADDLASEEEQENEDLKLHARPDQHYGNDSSSSEDEDDQLDSAPNDLNVDEMIAAAAAHDDLTAQIDGTIDQHMGQTAAPGGASAPSAAAPATSDGDGAAAPDGAAAAPVIPKGKSPAHFDSEVGNLVFFDVDVEVGGANCGIIQLSGVAHDQAGTLLGEFSKYVKPCPLSNAPTMFTQDNSVHSVSSPRQRYRQRQHHRPRASAAGVLRRYCHLLFRAGAHSVWVTPSSQLSTRACEFHRMRRSALDHTQPL